MKVITYSLLALCLTVSPGLAQTYVTLSGSHANYTFQGDTTYYVNGDATLTGATVIEGGAVIKYAAGKSINLTGTVVARTSPYHPAVFTAKDDDTVGIQIAGSTGSPSGYYANVALQLPQAGGSVLSHLRFRHARTAVAVGSLVDGVYPEDVLECLEFKHCDSGVAVTGPDDSLTQSSLGGSQPSVIGGGGGGLHARAVELVNTLFSEGSQVITGRLAHVNVFWLTADQTACVAYGSDVDVLVRESVLANVSQAGGGGAAISGSDNGYYHSTNALFGFSPYYVTPNYPFQSFNGNDYYLINGSPFVDAGGGTAAEAGLQNYTTQTDGTPDTGTVDLGYHYPAEGKDSTGTDFWVGFPYMSGTYNLSFYISSTTGATGTVTVLQKVPTTLIVTNCGDEAVNGTYVLTNLTAEEQVALVTLFDDESPDFGYVKGTNQVVLATAGGWPTAWWYLIGYDSDNGTAIKLYDKENNILDGSDWEQWSDDFTPSPTTISGEPVLFSYSFSVAAGATTRVAIPPAAMLFNNDAIGTNGIHIVANQPVSVYAFNHGAGASAAFTCYPTPLLGTNYCVLSRPSYSDGSSEFGLVATEDYTTVTITNSTGYGTTIDLQQGETYQINAGSSDGDLTGTQVTADKPIAVFAGDSDADVPSNSDSYANPLIQQQLPMELWGTNFVSLSFAGRTNGDSYRILAAYSNTIVTVTGAVVTVTNWWQPAIVTMTNEMVAVTITNAGEFYDIIIEGAAWFQADKPIQVAQFSNGEAFDNPNPPYAGKGDPCEILLPPTGHCSKTNIVYTSSNDNITGGFDDNYLNIIISQSAITNTWVDNSVVVATNFIAIGNSGYYGAQISVTNSGIHTIISSEPVEVEVYGWGYEDAYGYLGAFFK